MRVLVAVGSRHGATWEIGSSIARVLRDHGHQADLLPPEVVVDVQDYDAAVIGSAVYLTQLLPAVRELVEREAATLSARPLWVFASGLASPSSGARTGAELEALGLRLHARGFRTFRGRLDRAVLSFAERVAAAGVLNREGDHRDFVAVGRWAQEIAEELDALSGHRTGAPATAEC